MLSLCSIAVRSQHAKPKSCCSFNLSTESCVTEPHVLVWVAKGGEEQSGRCQNGKQDLLVEREDGTWAFLPLLFFFLSSFCNHSSSPVVLTNAVRSQCWRAIRWLFLERLLKDRGKDERLTCVTAAPPAQAATAALALHGQCLTAHFQFSLLA